MTGQEKNERSRVAGWSPAASARLKEAVKAYGSQAVVAEEAGISRPSLVEILAGRSVPTNGTFLSLCGVLGVEPDVIISANREAGVSPGDTLGGMALVPMHEVLVSAGHGIEAVEAGLSPEHLGFPIGWLRRQIGEPDKLRIVQVRGDSMAPTLHDGDLVMIDLGSRDPVDGIFVLRFEDQLMVKRVLFPSARRILVTSDNREYDRWDRMIDLESEAANSGFALIGRVVWAGRSM